MPVIGGAIIAGRSLQITYIADADKVLAAQRAIDRGHSTLESSTKRTGGVFSSTFGSVMPIAAAAAGAAIIKFGKDSVDAFNEAEQVMAQTEAVLKSTGGQANVTADDVLNLAQSLRDMSGADDEAIQSSANLLLTFRDVRNEAGAGNDVFNQTEAAILDMATAMNQGAIPSMEQLKSTTLQVGKAMNDPIKGMTALRRAGVSFTEAQVEQITKMQESGDLMGAQKIILDELSKEFGGAAKAAGDTFAGAQAKAAQKVEDLQEKIGAILVPVLTDLAETFADLITDLEPLIELIGTAFAAAVSTAADNLESMAGPLELILSKLPELGSATEEGSASWVDYAKAVGNIASPISLVTDPMSKLHDITSIVTGDFRDQEDALEDQPPVMQTVEAAARSMFDRFQDGTQVTNDLEDASRELTEQMRDQRLATLALSDSYLGILDSSAQVSEAQKTLNELERKGKEDTKAYEAAVLDAISAQIGLEDAVLSYGQELIESGASQAEVTRKIKEMGRELGIDQEALKDIIREIKNYIAELNNIPSDVTTTVHLVGDVTGVGGPAPLAAGGIVTRPTIALVGESGPEAVIPLSGRNQVQASGGTSIDYDELARAIAREIDKLDPKVLPVAGFSQGVLGTVARTGLRRMPT